jgi:transcriptional regulator with XRE-family HTH domain
VRNRFTESVSRDYLAPMRQNFANVRDVANYAGVSATTVSRYLNGSMVLPPDTAARIERACKHLSYRPNQLAKRLSLGSSELIGLVTPEIPNPFFVALAAAPPRGPNEIECAGIVADPAVAEYGGLRVEDFRRSCSTVSV